MRHHPFLEDVMAEAGPVETLAQALALFETVGMPARNLAARTRAEYRRDIADLIAYLEGNGITRLDQVGLRELEGYQAEMDRRGWAASSRQRKTHALKVWFAFLARHGILGATPAEKLIAPPVRRKEPRFLSEDEYRTLLRACSHHARDAAVVELLLQTGMRLSELACLTTADVTLPGRITREVDNLGAVTVRRKGGKVDTIPLNHKACQALAAYLKVRPKAAPPALFLSKYRTPLRPRDIQRRLARYLAEAGIRGASVHTLRHTMATHHVARGTDLKTVQETLGHASLETTSLYVSLAKQAQKKALQEHAL